MELLLPAASSEPGRGREAPSRRTGELALAIGLMAWVAIMLLYWPGGLSFQDDVGYVGEARILLAGRVLPGPADPGVWVSTARGGSPQYPLFPSLLLVPFLAATPRAVFAVEMSAAIALCLITSRILKSWGQSPVWGLLLIAHPTVVIVARTAMADLALSAFALGGWWALRQRRRVLTVLLFAALFATKPTGVILGLALGGGELLRLVPALRRRDREVWGRVATIGFALSVGFAGVFLMNEVATGRLWFAYDQRFRTLGIPPFSLSYFSKIAPAQLRTVLLFPPLLVLGALPFWRRRELGPLCLIFGFGTMMCFYCFVDFGTTRLESLTLAPRLLLPVVSFLLVGYADELATIAQRIPRAKQWLPPALVTGTSAVALAISIRHHRWQTPMTRAIDFAVQATRQLGTRELGVTAEATKAGMLFPGPTRLVDPAAADAAVVLCSTRSGSYRQPDGVSYRCTLAGYRSYRQVGDYEVLVRQESSSVGTP